MTINLTCAICFTENPDSNTHCLSCGEALLMGTANYHLQPGTILTSQHTKYQIEKTLGSGGFGITYKAIELSSATPVAIKESWREGATRQNSSILLPSSISPKDYQEQIKKVISEAQYIYECSHPNIVKVYEWFFGNNTAYIVMELINGQSLYQLLQKQGHLPEYQVTKYLISICEALKIVHGKGLLHRDIKPENILVDDNDRAVLIDFGNAREYIADKTHRMSQIVSHGYSPIEQYGSLQRRDHRLDIYALCATMYELITGQQPPSATDRYANDPLIPPSKCANIIITPVLESVILKGMKMNVLERFDTVDQLIEGLKGNPPDVTKARELVKQGQLNQAIPLYWQCVNELQHIEASVELAMICIYIDDKEAEKASNKAIQLNPNDGRGHGILGLVHCRQKNWTEAVKHLQIAVKLAPSQVWIQGNLIWALGKMGNWQAAQSLINQALKLEPESAFLLGLSAWIFVNLKQYQFAIRYAKQAIFRSRQLSNEKTLQQWIYPCLAIALIKDSASQSSSELSDCINKFVTQVPQSAWAWGLKGWYAGKKQLRQEAESSFSHAMTQNNIPHWVLINQSILYETLNNTPLAISTYEQYLQHSSDSAFVYFRLGTLLGRINQWQKAQTNLEKSIQLSPDYAEAYHNLGWVLLNLRDISGNIQYSRELLSNYGKAIELYRQQNKLTMAQSIQHQFQLININL